MNETTKVEGRIPAPDETQPTFRAVVAKMKCQNIESNKWSPAQVTHKVRLGAIYGTEGENAAFTKYTPSGECWMQIDAEAPALGFLNPGRSIM